MTATLSSYDLTQIINKRFVPSLESEQEIEIETDQVIINQVSTVDDELESLNDETSEAKEAASNYDAVVETTETLESLIYSMESSVLIGGFDVKTASVANIALESIATRFDIDANQISFGLEATMENGEAETKSTIDKAKTMLGALKDNAGALINKMYTAAAAALGSTAALSEKLLQVASRIRSNINSANKGGVPVSLPKSVKRKLTLDGVTVLPADKYVMELKRLVAKYNDVVKVYADTNVLSAFSQDILNGMAGKTGQVASQKAIINTVNVIASDIKRKQDTTDGMEAATSDAYLGGARITLTRPTAQMVYEALFPKTSTTTVSQEAKGKPIRGAVKVAFGAILYTLGLSGFVSASLSLGHYLAVLIGTLLKDAFAVQLAEKIGITLPMLAGISVLNIIIIFAIALAFTKGMEASVRLIKSGGKDLRPEIMSAVNKLKNATSSKSKEAAYASTEFSLDTTNVSNEAEQDATTVNSLSASQIKTVTDIISNTAATTKTMKAELAKRKSVAASIDKIAKGMVDKEDGKSNEATTAARLFIKKYIKQTTMFEMQLTSYTVGVMKAALAYAEASNNATAPTETNTPAE